MYVLFVMVYNTSHNHRYGSEHEAPVLYVTPCIIYTADRNRKGFAPWHSTTKYYVITDGSRRIQEPLQRRPTTEHGTARSVSRLR